MDYKGNLWSAIPALIIGIVLICYSNIAVSAFVRIMGVTFIVIAILNFSYELSRRRKINRGVSVSGMISSVATGLLGVIMFFMPDDLVKFIVYLFAGAFVLLGLYQMFVLSFSYKPITFPFGFYVMPAILIIGGVVVCILGAENVTSFFVIAMGVAFVIYALATFINIAGLLSFRRRLAKEQKAADNAAQADTQPVENVEAEDVNHSDSTDVSKPFWPAE